MANTRWQLNDAMVRRIAKGLTDHNAYGVAYSTAVRLLREENCAQPERMVQDLIQYLDRLGYSGHAIQLGASAAYEAAKARKAIAEFRRALTLFVDHEVTDAPDTRDGFRIQIWNEE